MMRRHACFRHTLSAGLLVLAALLGASGAGCQGTPYHLRFDAAALDVRIDTAPDVAPDVVRCTPDEGESLLAGACGWCHSSPTGLDLISPGIVDRMIGVSPEWASAAPFGCRDHGPLLEPTLPPAGLFLDKLAGDSAPCGSSMSYMSRDRIECVRQWLALQIAERADASADATDGGAQDASDQDAVSP